MPRSDVAVDCSVTVPCSAAPGSVTVTATVLKLVDAANVFAGRGRGVREVGAGGGDAGAGEQADDGDEGRGRASRGLLPRGGRLPELLPQPGERDERDQERRERDDERAHVAPPERRQRVADVRDAGGDARLSRRDRAGTSTDRRPGSRRPCVR